MLPAYLLIKLSNASSKINLHRKKINANKACLSKELNIRSNGFIFYDRKLVEMHK